MVPSYASQARDCKLQMRDHVLGIPLDRFESEVIPTIARLERGKFRPDESGAIFFCILALVLTWQAETPWRKS